MADKEDRPWYHIKAGLAANDTSLASLARQHGKTKSAFTKVKYLPIPSIQSAIAKALGEKPQEVWPTRYNQSGKPIRPLKWSRNNTRRLACGHRQKSAVA